jgi:type II secretory pathway pseudopilin PulG
MRRQAGYTLVELMIGMTLSLLLITVSLMIGTNAIKNRDAVERQNEAQQQARLAVDRIARQLRNLASPTDLVDPTKNQPLSVERNGRYDLVFRTVEDVGGATSNNPTGVKRVRYCLDASNPSASKVWRQEQPPSAVASGSGPPADLNCPGTGWTSRRIVAEHVVNRYGGQDRPLWSYLTDGRELAYDAPGDLPSTTRVETRLFVDITPGYRETETALSSSVLLRNQNRAPTADFTVSLSGRTVQLNGSASKDPENERLTYEWFDGDTKIPGADGIVFTITYPGPGTHQYWLRVSDVAGLTGTSEKKTVVVS